MITRNRRAPVLGTLLALTVGLTGLAGEASARSNLAGKVFFSPTKLKDSAPKAVSRLFAKAKPSIEIKRKDGGWQAVLVGFFRKPAIDGPVTLWFFDKSDKGAIKRREAMHIATAHGGAKGKVLVWDMDLRENDGFNKNRSYLIKVGQIVGKRSRIYAKGEVKLLP